MVAAISIGCGGPPSSDGQSGASGAMPELDDQIVNERINDAWVGPVPEENGASDPITWGFDENEPKEIVVLERQIEGTKATLVLDIKTSSSPRSTNQRYLAGQIRTKWELKSGWALRRWEIVNTENISMKYRNLPKQPQTENKETPRNQ